ncbi:MAG: hydroxymethylbilane synthase, partial [Neisseriaceae bacterium]|nr:hydroxymethylbilane synthase [Neisseriaceae bacterium]
EDSLPAAGQGALGIEIAAHRDDMREILSPLNHALTADCTTAERSLARVLGGSCQVPLAAYATLAENDILSLRGLVARPDGTSVLIAQASAPRRYAEQLGRAVAKLLEDDGAKELIAEVLAQQ